MGNGTNVKCWALPKELLTHHSLFFASALNGSSAEANSETMNLPDDDPKAFSSFIRWLYTGNVEHDPDTLPLAQAWMLAKKLECSAFSDKALLKMIEYHGKDRAYLKPSTIQFAYKNSPEGSKLRNWALDKFLWATRIDACHNFKDSDMKDLMELDGWGVDLMRAMKRLGSDYPTSPRAQPDVYMEVFDPRMARSMQRRSSSAFSRGTRDRSWQRSISPTSRGGSLNRFVQRSTSPTSRHRGRTTSFSGRTSSALGYGRLSDYAY